MKDKKKSFILHHDSLGIIGKLDDDQAGKLFRAIWQYNISGEIDCDMQTELLLFPFQSQFDRDKEAYNKIVERNKNNGSKGGRPKKQQEPKKPTGLSGNPKKARKADSVNDSESGNGSDNEKQKKEKSAKANEPVLIFEYWKEVMKKTNSAQFTAGRLKAVKARLKDGYTVEQIKQAIKGCSLTPHNMGQNDNGKLYDCLSLICRSGEHLERFSGNAEQLTTDNNPPPTKGGGRMTQEQLEANLNDTSWGHNLDDIL